MTGWQSRRPLPPSTAGPRLRSGSPPCICLTSGALPAAHDLLGAEWAREQPGTPLRVLVLEKRRRGSAELWACFGMSKGGGHRFCVRVPGGVLSPQRAGPAGGAKRFSRALPEVSCVELLKRRGPSEDSSNLSIRNTELAWDPLIAGKGQGTTGQGSRRPHCSVFQLRMAVSGSVSLRSRRSGSVGVAACSLTGRME